MTLQLPNNVTFDVYRKFNVNAPYPPAGKLPDLATQVGSLNQHVKCGRFGFQTNHVYWTYELITATSVDIRDAYNSEHDQTRNNANADTIFVNDFPIVGWCTGFYVVAVIRDRSKQFNRVYLDRLQPVNSPCMPTPAAKTCCGGFIVPDTLYATIAGCPCLAGTYAMAYIPTNHVWIYGPTAAPSCGPNGPCYLYLLFGCGTQTDCSGLNITLELNNLITLGGVGAIGGAFLQGPCTCKQPINWTVQPFTLGEISGSGICDSCVGPTINIKITS